MRNTIAINNLTALVALTVKYGEGDRKYTFSKRSSNDWLDPVAGEAWQKEEYALDEKWHEVAKEETAKQGAGYIHYRDLRGYQDELEVLKASQPERQWVNHYHLYGKYGDTLALSKELGENVAKVWRTGTYGNFVGTITLKGLCKKLGENGLDATIKAATLIAKAQKAQETRNHHRTILRQKIAELTKSFAEMEDLGIDPNQMTIAQMLTAIGEDEV
jgi:hypothetical protein